MRTVTAGHGHNKTLADRHDTGSARAICTRNDQNYRGTDELLSSLKTETFSVEVFSVEVFSAEEVSRENTSGEEVSGSICRSRLFLFSSLLR